MIIKDLEYLENMEFELPNSFGGLVSFGFRVTTKDGVTEFVGTSTDTLEEFLIKIAGIGEGSAKLGAIELDAIVGTLASASS